LFDEILLSDSVKNRYDIEIQLTNASSKTILAYEVSIQGMPDVGAGFHYLHQTDHFFRSQLHFVPGAQEVVSFSNPAWSTVPGGKQDAQVAAASYKVLFVEFADGTKFGTSHWADNLSSARQLAIQRMQELAAARDASGEQGLRSSLAVVVTRSDDPQTTRTVMAHLKETLDSEGSDAVGHEIKEFLSTAQARREVM
jgi:hypothetical protein